MRWRTLKIISDVFASCMVLPFSRPCTRTLAGSRSVSIHGPMGQKVSNDFARAHCPSFFWQSRALTSWPHV